MNNRVTSDSGNSVSLFPFLAVLLCTMGALLVLLVVLAQRAGRRAAAEAASPAVVYVSSKPPEPSDSSKAAQLVEQLDEVREYQQRLTKLRKQADRRLLEEQQRLSHLEGHARRLEHELARLSIAVEQLNATEQDQSVDQGQAERELARLQQLIKETEARLKELRDQSQGQRSYAIVPYRGPNGTYRKPIYIECRGDGIVLHPEGIRLKSSDFAATSWAGNPLAAALRATREHVNAQAASGGSPEPPDPYPMILVRPDGIRQYHLARAAIKSWDAHYGYEFIDSDWELDFPELPDPQLARVQQHAIFLARQRLARLIRSAPSRFGGMGARGSGSGAGGGNSGSSSLVSTDSDGGRRGDGGEFNAGAPIGESESSGLGDGDGFASNQSGSEPTPAYGSKAESGEFQNGVLGAEPSAAGEAAASGELAEGDALSANEFAEATGSRGRGDRYAETAGSGGSSASSAGSPAAANSAKTSAGQASASGSAASGSSAAAGRGSAAGGQAASIADSRGRNWAVQSGGPSAVAIRRPIQVVVRPDQLALLPSRHAIDGVAATGKVISLNQSQQEISSEFVTALRRRVEEWGLAGNDLYWRPILKLNVGPGAEQTAHQVLRLLRDSGVEVSLPDTARTPHRANLDGTTDASR